MSARFEELDWQATPMGEISLRRRREPVLDVDVYEVQLNDEFLMSSLFTVSEIELAHLGVAAHGGADLEVLVGGLGLGYTARAALADDRVREVTVVEAIAPVLDWHRRDLLPDTVGLAADPHCHLVHDDFFALVGQQRSTATYDVVLLDVDHTPGTSSTRRTRRLLRRGTGPAVLPAATRRGLRAVVRRPARPGLPRGAPVRLRLGRRPRRVLPQPPHRRDLRLLGLRREAPPGRLTIEPGRAVRLAAGLWAG